MKVVNTSAVFTRYQKELYNYIYKVTTDKTISEDILQEVFIKVHLKKESLQDDTKLKPWLYTIVRNTINDYYRKHKQNKELDTDIIAEEKPETHNDDFSKCLRHFVAKLPYGYKDALRMTTWGKYTQKEYAAKRGISESGAKSRIQRARQQLLAQYRQCCHFTTDVYGNILDNTCNNPCHS